jgi:hypothetical protein
MSEEIESESPTPLEEVLKTIHRAVQDAVQDYLNAKKMVLKLTTPPFLHELKTPQDVIAWLRGIIETDTIGMDIESLLLTVSPGEKRNKLRLEMFKDYVIQIKNIFEPYLRSLGITEKEYEKIKKIVFVYLNRKAYNEGHPTASSYFA